METHILYFVAAVAAGLINSMAGGGGLITFPSLTLVVPPVVADATSALALLPAYPSAVWRTRAKLSEVSRRWLWLLLVPSVLGGLVRALMLIWTARSSSCWSRGSPPVVTAPPMGIAASRRRSGRSRRRSCSWWPSTADTSGRASAS